MFTSCQNIEIYHNQLKKRYNQVRQKYAAKIENIDQNSSMYGLKLPFQNLSQVGRTNKTIQQNTILSNNSALSNPISIENCSLSLDPNLQRPLTDRGKPHQEENQIEDKQNFSVNIVPYQFTRSKNKKVTIQETLVSQVSLKDIQSTNQVNQKNKYLVAGSCQKLKELKQIDLNRENQSFNENNIQMHKYNGDQNIVNEQEHASGEIWGQHYQLSYSNNGTQLGYSSLFNMAKKSNSTVILEGQITYPNQSKERQTNSLYIADESSLLQQQIIFNISLTSFAHLNGSNDQLSNNTSILKQASFKGQIGTSATKLHQKRVSISIWPNNIIQEQSGSNSGLLSESQSINEGLYSEQALKLPFLQTIIQKNSQLANENSNTQRVSQQANKEHEASKSTGLYFRQKSFTDNYLDIMETVRRISSLCVSKERQDNAVASNLQDLCHNINNSVGKFKKTQIKFSHQNHLTFGILQ